MMLGVGAWEAAALAAVQDRSRLAICVPHRDIVSFAWCHNFAVTLKSLHMPVGFFYDMGHPLDVARDVLAQNVLRNTKCEWIFWWDSDVALPDNAIPSMLATAIQAKLKLLSGLYFAKKKEAKLPAAWIKTPETDPGFAPLSPQNTGLVQVDVVGMGACLTHRSVFEALSRPWFLWEKDRFLDGAVSQGPSEDFYFFLKCARELGIKPVVDFNMRCHHIGIMQIDGKDGTMNLPEV